MIGFSFFFITLSFRPWEEKIATEKSPRASVGGDTIDVLADLGFHTLLLDYPLRIPLFRSCLLFYIK